MPTERDRVTGAARAGPRQGWQRVHDELSTHERADLSAEQLDALADAFFWLDRPDESIEARRDAYRAHVAAGAVGQAALVAWRLFYDHFLVGELAVANGWLERCRRHVDAETSSSASSGWLAVAETDRVLAQGDAELALAHARKGREIAERAEDPDLLAMALQAEGRALIAADQQQRGLAALDEAMVAVINDELAPLYTGWVFCNVISTCYGLADLRRATEWSEAAMRWCESLREGLMYPGLCRVYSVELACLRGDWTVAEQEAQRACRELTAHDPRYAGEAIYLTGELHRLRGQFHQAEAAFAHAHELGRLPQPGLALLRSAQGRKDEAVPALRSALQPGSQAPLQRAQLLSALVELELELGDREQAGAHAGELEEIAGGSLSPLLKALAHAARSQVLLALENDAGALAQLRDSWQALHDAGLTYEAARLRVHIGLAVRRFGDEEAAQRDLRASLSAFEGLKAEPDVGRVRNLLAAPPAGDSTTHRDLPAELTAREADVLRLVAEGHTNRAIADILVVSPHTVARHMSNIFTKLGVTSRSAATAFAYEHGIVTAAGTAHKKSH